MNTQGTSDDLRWDTYLAVFTHGVLLLMLWGVICFLAPPPSQLMPEGSGTIPLKYRLLIGATITWLKHGFIILLLFSGFLFADGWVYSSLCLAKGKRAGNLWAAGVTTVIVLAITWYAVLGRLWLNELVRWRIK